jgi:adenylate cyclase
VLEGSVRKAADRVRITAQLIDAPTGHHLWAQRYDRDLKDIFALQDEITMRILTALRVRLTEGEQARLHDKGTENLDSFLKVLQGMHYFYRFNKDDNTVARQMFEEAVPLDPENPVAHTFLGWTHVMDVWFGSSKSPEKSMERASELAQKAIALDENQDSPHSLLGHIYLMKRQYDMAIAEGERAVALSPNGADAHGHLAMTLNHVGRREEATALFKKAIRLNPMPPNWYLTHLAFNNRLTGKYEEAIGTYQKVLRRNPDDFWAHTGLAATYSMAGREEEARAQSAEVLRIDPKFSVEYFAKTIPYKNQADIELAIDALRKAGLK